MESDFFAALARDAGQEGLPFLIVGGHAVNAYGYLRTTLDADLLVPEGRADEWRAFWERRGYRCFHASDAFLQFRAAVPSVQFPVDIMIVSEATFSSMSESRHCLEIGGARMDVPDPLHLIALKLHALKSPSRASRDRDVSDIAGLVRSCGIDTRGVEFRQVMERYGDESTRIEIERRLGQD